MDLDLDLDLGHLAGEAEDLGLLGGLGLWRDGDRDAFRTEDPGREALILVLVPALAPVPNRDVGRESPPFDVGRLTPVWT